ncbi:uncharacterized protein LOC144617365 [Panthera onca]
MPFTLVVLVWDFVSSEGQSVLKKNFVAELDCCYNVISFCTFRYLKLCSDRQLSYLEIFILVQFLVLLGTNEAALNLGLIILHYRGKTLVNTLNYTCGEATFLNVMLPFAVGVLPTYTGPDQPTKPIATTRLDMNKRNKKRYDQDI